MLSFLRNFLFKFYKIQLIVIFLFFLIFIFFSLYPSSSISKFIVKQNSDYFVFGINNNKIKNLYYDFVIQRFYKNNFAKSEVDIKNISKKTKQYLVSTSETTFYGYNLKPTYYGVSLGHIIILGQAACEGINGVLGIRLSKNFKNIELYSLFNNKSNTSPHTLLRLKEGDDDLFIDIHPINKIYFFAFQKNINLGNEIFESSYKDFDKSLFDNGFTSKKFDLFSYFVSLIKKIIPIDDYTFSTVYKEKKSYSTNINSNEINKNYLVNKFIDARFEHIAGNKKDADELYNEIIQTNCKYDFCKIASIVRMKESYL